LYYHPVSGGDWLFKHGVRGWGGGGLHCCTGFVIGFCLSGHNDGFGGLAGLAIAFVELGGHVWDGGEAKVVARVADEVLVETIAAVAREEAGAARGTLDEIWAGGKKRYWQQ